MVHIILYLLLCVIAGLLGRDSRLGFWGVAAVGLFFTPIAALLLVLGFGRRGTYVWVVQDRFPVSGGLQFDPGAPFEEDVRPNSFLARHRFGIALGLLIFSFVFILFWDEIVVSLRAGQQGIYWSRFFGGTSDRILLDGTHLKFPWDEITIYDSRVSAVSGKVPMLSKDGMQIDVEWIARYRPDPTRIPELHRVLGPEYRDKVVVPDVVSSLRQIVGDYTAEEIYTQDEEPMLAMVETRVKPLVSAHPIFLERVQILRLNLPKDMAQGIVNKLLHKQEMLSYDYRIKAEQSEATRKEIEAQGIRDFEKVSGVSILKWRGIAATTELAKSPNSKVIVMGSGSNALPILLNADK